MSNPVNDPRNHCGETEQLEHPANQPQDSQSVSRSLDKTAGFLPTPDGKADRGSSKHRQKIKAAEADREKNDRHDSQQHGEIAANKSSVYQFGHFGGIEALRT